MSEKNNFQINPSVIFREIGDQCLLVPIGQTVDEVRNIFTLNESAAFVYKQLQKEKSLDELMTSIQTEYECDNETETKKWVYGIIEEFRANNIVL